MLDGIMYKALQCFSMDEVNILNIVEDILSGNLSKLGQGIGHFLLPIEVSFTNILHQAYVENRPKRLKYHFPKNTRQGFSNPY